MTPFQHFAAFIRQLLASRSRPPARRVRKDVTSRPEPLESRIAPAMLVSPYVVTYKDGSNNLVTIKSSLPIFTSAATADSVLTFDTAGSVANKTTAAETLHEINLAAIFSGAPGDSLSITDGGKNTADVGFINSSHHLGTVTVQGNLGRIDAGEAIGTGSASATGLAHLKVHSLGSAGQLLAGDSLSSKINGSIGSVTIDTNVTGAILDAVANPVNAGNIGSVRIGGSLIGGIDALSGSISASGKIRSVSILGSVAGGDGNASGAIVSTGALGSVVIHGSVTGGNGDHSGEISAASISAVTIDGALKGHTFANYSGTASTPPTALDSGQITTTAGNIGTIILGDLIGQGGAASGSIISEGLISKVSIQKIGTGSSATSGSVTGGDGAGSGQINGVSLGRISIAGAVTGGPVADSGAIVSNGSITSVTVGGGITGGAGASSGSITTGSSGAFGANLGSLTITGDLHGGTGNHSGEVNVAGTIGTVAISGSMIGNTGVDSGSIFSADTVSRITVGKLTGGEISVGNNLGALTITGGPGTVDSGLVEVAGDAGTITVKGDVTGSTQALPGEILVGGGLRTLRIFGKLQGGGADDTGSVFAALDGTSSLGSATIAGGIFGGGGIASGQLSSGGSMGHVSTGPVTGDAGSGSGSIITAGALGSVTIQGNVTGGSGPDAGEISSGTSLSSLALHGSLQSGAAVLSHTLNTAYAETPGNIGSITITAGIAGGRIDAQGDISHLTVTGDVVGTGSTGVIMGNHIGTLTISGALQNGSILAGEDITSLSLGSVLGQAGSPVTISAAGQAKPGKTRDLALGKISIGGDLSFANILAGYDQSGNAVNGAASIGAVTVKGNWTAGNLVAGVKIGTDQVFGTADDALITPDSAIIPRIASVIIKGHIESTSSHYGFVAEQIGTFSVGGKALKLATTPNVPDIFDPTAMDTAPRSPDAPTDNETAVREVIS